MSSSARALPLSELVVASRVLLSRLDFEAPSCVVYSNFCNLNPSFGHQHKQTLWVRAVHQIPSVILGRLPRRADLIVPSGEDFIPVTEDLDVVSEQIPPYLDHDQITEMAARMGPPTTVDQVGVLIGRFGIRTWGHWLGELLPKIVAVEEAFPGKLQYILPQEILTKSGFGTLVESLACYGIGFERLFPLGPGRYRFQELLCVSSVWSPNKMHPHAAQLMRDRCRVRLTDSPSTSIALLRGEVTTRNIGNLAEVKRTLEDAGFKSVEIGRLSFADQVRAFAAADTVAGVLGSGLTGLIFAKPGVKVLSFAPSGWGDLFFFSLMQLRDATVADIRGMQADGDARSPAIAKFALDPNEVRNGLAALT